MTSVDTAAPLESPSPSDAKSRWDRMDDLLERWGDRLNPILVKEARQALKSRQFLVTFTLLLICAWGWSMTGVAFQRGLIYSGEGGQVLFSGYFFILTIPLLLIVPFTAFRSLAAERDDGTYELLSITALSARQIITGKLGSSCLQMLVYLSAIAPCIAFTYLLRGVDVASLSFVLVYTVFISVLFSTAALLLATLCRNTGWQVGLSLLVIVGLLMGTFSWFGIMMDAVIDRGGAFPVSEPWFWHLNLALLCGHVSLVVLFIFAAAAQISFASDNRSTRVRVVMFVQQFLWVMWLLFFWLTEQQEEILYFMFTMAAVYWAISGALLSGEVGELSSRVKRSLPQSFLGRCTLTWFNPGSGTGYVFAVGNLLGVVIVAYVAALNAPNMNMRSRVDLVEMSAGLAMVAYVAAYLGVGRLLILATRRWLPVGPLVSLLLNAVLAAAGIIVPMVFQLMFFTRQYTAMQLPNWAWTCGELMDGRQPIGLSNTVFGVPPLVWPVLFVGGVIFAFNLIAAGREVEHVRQEVPHRVSEDEKELHPERHREPEPTRDPLA